MSGDVLERNVRLLLRRSWVPALPAPHFRDRLESLFLAELARRAQPAPRVHRVHPVRRAGAWLAVSAALVALLLGIRFLVAGSPATRTTLLARHEVALGLPDGTWRAASDEERFHGLFFRPPALTAVTPEGASLEILVGAGRVHLEERSELRVEARGKATLARLVSGSATFLRGSERHVLEPGIDALLAPETPAAVAPASGEPVASREALPPGETPPTEAVQPARLLTARLETGDEPAPARFTVALLPERRGNEVPAPEQREFEGADGTFRWPDPPTGRQRVFVQAEGWALCALGEHDLDTPSTELTARLERGTSVSGIVLDTRGAPVPGALVLSEMDAPTDALLLQDTDRAFWLPIQARTGPDGRFELAHLNAGVHTLRASARGVAPAWAEGVHVPRADGELVLTLPSGGTVTGSVARDDGGPWADAGVILVAMDESRHDLMNFDRTVTDIDGRYRFEHAPARTMIVVLLRTRERPDVRPVQVVEGAVVTADFDVPARGIRVSGRLLDASGAPLARQNLGLFDSKTASWNQDWIGTSTGDDGAFTFDGIAPGRYLVYLIDAMGSGLHCVDALEIGASPPEVEHDVRIPTGSIAVRVLDTTGAPAAETTLILESVAPDGRHDFSGFALSDAEGRCTLGSLPEGRYRVCAYPTRDGLAFQRSEVVEVGPQPGAVLEMRLEAGGALDVVVRTSAGRALDGAAVSFLDEHGETLVLSRLPLTDAAGHYRAAGLRAGSYHAVAQLPGHHGPAVPFTFEPGRERTLTVLLDPDPQATPSPR